MKALSHLMKETEDIDYPDEVLPGILDDVCRKGDVCAKRLCDHMGASLVDGFGWRRKPDYPDVGGWYLYESLYPTYLVVDLDEEEPPVPSPIEETSELDSEACTIWNDRIPLLGFLARCLREVEDDAYDRSVAMEELLDEGDPWCLWLDAADTYCDLYRQTCEEVIRSVVGATDGLCELWNSDEGEKLWREEVAA